MDVFQRIFGRILVYLNPRPNFHFHRNGMVPAAAEPNASFVSLGESASLNSSLIYNNTARGRAGPARMSVLFFQPFARNGYTV